jgi:hypothetical protein
MTDRGDRIERPTLPPWRVRWVRLGPLGRDLTVVLAIKFAALFLLWWAFFSPPGTQEVTVTAPRVKAHLVPPASPEQPPHANR